MSAIRAKRSEHFAAVDGLRGIACLAVVAHHCYVHCGRYQWPVVEAGGHEIALSRIFSYGNGGVELFFVVSGFCLAYPFCSRSEHESWSRWFLRRAYRILPPYYASVLLFWGMYAVLRTHPLSLFGITSPPAGPISLKGVFVCVTLINAYFNPSYWTLALEARWYLLFPVLMGLWRRTGSALLCVACALTAAAAIWLTRISPPFGFVTGQVLAFLPILVSGMVIASWTAGNRTPPWLIRLSPWGLLASLVLIAWAIPSDGGTSLVHEVVPWGFFAFFTLVTALNNKRLSALARSPVLVKVGAFSYSLYLIHEPFVHLAYGMLQQLKLTPAEQFLIYECALLPVCVGLGYLFYRAVERPLMQHASTLFKRASPPALASPST